MPSSQDGLPSFVKPLYVYASAITVHAAAKSAGGILQARASLPPRGRGGTAACASSSQPTKGRLGFEISGFRPSRHAHTYQRNTAATRSPRPSASGRVARAATASSAVTNAAESCQASTLGKTRVSGLAEACGIRPAPEKSSPPHGTSTAKCTSR